MRGPSRLDPERTSRRLAWALRHRPDACGLLLDRAGWAAIERVISGLGIDRAALDAVLAVPGKRRFEIDRAGDRIRALHGHTVLVELGHPECAPPEWLFHGTVAARIASIAQHGLLAGRRRQVHLSSTREEAREVGARRGTPIVLAVRAAALHADGGRFTKVPGSAVWLVDRVPPAYLVLPDAPPK